MIYSKNEAFCDTAFSFRHYRVHTKNMNDEESDYKAQKNKQNAWCKKLSDPETDNLSKDIRQTKDIQK